MRVDFRGYRDMGRGEFGPYRGSQRLAFFSVTVQHAAACGKQPPSPYPIPEARPWKTLRVSHSLAPTATSKEDPKT